MKSRSQIAIERLDEVANQCELRWGIGRLPKLVPIDLAERFYRQKAKLDEAINEEATGGSVANVEFEANRMVNAWMALNGSAEADGADPLNGTMLEARLSDGRLLVICARPEMAREAARDRSAAVWTIDEVARVLEGFDLVMRTKHLFEGAIVEEVRVRPDVNWRRGDELPDDMRNQFLAAG